MQWLTSMILQKNTPVQCKFVNLFSIATTCHMLLNATTDIDLTWQMWVGLNSSWGAKALDISAKQVTSQPIIVAVLHRHMPPFSPAKIYAYVVNWSWWSAGTPIILDMFQRCHYLSICHHMHFLSSPEKNVLICSSPLAHVLLFL